MEEQLNKTIAPSGKLLFPNLFIVKVCITSASGVGFTGENVWLLIQIPLRFVIKLKLVILHPEDGKAVHTTSISKPSRSEVPSAGEVVATVGFAYSTLKDLLTANSLFIGNPSLLALAS